MKRYDRVQNDGVNTSSKSKMLRNQIRLSMGSYKDNYRSPK
jgi:hypothetical protein